MKPLTISALLVCSLTCGVADEPRPVVVGKQAPDFTATGVDGKTFRLSDKLESGKKNFVLLFSRAHW